MTGDPFRVYSIAYDLEKNTTPEKVVNHKIEMNEFYFYDCDFRISTRVLYAALINTEKWSFRFIWISAFMKSNIWMVDDGLIEIDKT